MLFLCKWDMMLLTTICCSSLVQTQVRDTWWYLTAFLNDRGYVYILCQMFVGISLALMDLGQFLQNDVRNFVKIQCFNWFDVLEQFPDSALPKCSTKWISRVGPTLSGSVRVPETQHFNIHFLSLLRLRTASAQVLRNEDLAELIRRMALQSIIPNHWISNAFSCYFWP